MRGTLQEPATRHTLHDDAARYCHRTGFVAFLMISLEAKLISLEV